MRDESDQKYRQKVERERGGRIRGTYGLSTPTDRAGPGSVSDGAADAGRSPVSSCGESAGDGDTKGQEILAETQTRLQRDERAGREDVPGRLGSGGDAFNARCNSESFVEPGKVSRTEQVAPGYL